MPVKIFFPRVPDNEDDFRRFLGQICPAMVSSIKIVKNPDGRPFCIIAVNYCDTNGKCALDIIEAMSGKSVGEVILKPRIYLDSVLLKQLDLRLLQKDTEDDFVNVTHYYQDYYYVQLKSEKDRNRIIRENLRTLYEQFQANMLNTLEFNELSEGQLYATVFMNDGYLYRVKVVEKCASGEIKALFIDYGNIEIIENQPILEIDEDLTTIPPLAHKCCIDNVRIIDEKKHDLYSREVLNRNFKAKLIKTVNEDGLERVIAIDFLNFCMVSYRSFLIVESIAVECNIESDEKLDYKGLENGMKEMVNSVVMTHMSSLNEFYVQQANKDVDDNLASIVRLTDYLTSRLRDNLQYIEDNILYLTKFTGDGNWYRSKVIENNWEDSEDPHCLVQFIDFGNSEKKGNVKDLKPLTKEWSDQASELSKIIPCAHRCCLNKTLINGLSEENIDEAYFLEKMILTEKIMEIYYVDNGKVWTVNNVIIKSDNENEEVDLMTKYAPSLIRDSPDLSSPNLYRLSNLESIHKIWFQLVFTSEPERFKQIQIIKKWSSGNVPSNSKHLTSVTLNSLCCAVNKHGHLYRCRVTAKNIDRAIVQFIDSGLHEVVKLSSLFPLRSSIADIPPLAKVYKLSLKVQYDEEEEVEKKLIMFVQHSEVELELLSENVIKDVIIKEKSLIESLAKYTVVGKGDKYKDLPECLLPPVTEEGDVDFSLPSVDKMNEVPLDIAVENGRVKILRKLFHMTDDDKNVFEGLWEIVLSCEKLNQFVQCCGDVDNIVNEMECVKNTMCEVVMNRASKFRDLQQLLDTRTSLCNNTCKLYEDLQSLLSQTSEEDLQVLLDKVQSLLSGITHILDILKITPSTNDEDAEDIGVLQNEVTLFHQTSLYQETILPHIRESAQITDLATAKLRNLLEVMIREYALQDDLPAASGSITVPLVDVTYEVHSAMKNETSQIINHVLSLPDVNIINILIKCHYFLHSKKTVLDSVIIKTKKLHSLHKTALSILAEDSQVIRHIEDTHKKILSNRSALRHAVPDLEDAEELDLKERQQELMIKIRDIRKSLHVDLRTSIDITRDAEIRQLMLKKPELQLKNQSIFFNEHGIPIFVWDSIYLEMSHESSFCDSYMESFFTEDKVKIRKISLSKEHYKTTLSNISVFSSTLSSVNQVMDIIPILFVFMSKSGHISIYVVVPDFTIVSKLPPQITEFMITIVTFFKHVLDQLVVLWHLGYIFTEEDLKHALFYEYKDNEGNARVTLPLPLSSIVNRDKISETPGSCKEASLSVSMKKVSSMFRETLQQCKENEVLSELVCEINCCGEIEQVERVVEKLEEFIINMTKEDNVEEGEEEGSSLSGHGSSIEQVKEEEEDGEDKTVMEDEESTLVTLGEVELC